jgi:hypothetical protein
VRKSNFRDFIRSDVAAENMNHYRNRVAGVYHAAAFGDYLRVFRSKHATAADEKKFRIGFLPVICDLTCPVTDFINKQITSESIFELRRRLVSLPALRSTTV